MLVFIRMTNREVNCICRTENIDDDQLESKTVCFVFCFFFLIFAENNISIWNASYNCQHEEFIGISKTMLMSISLISCLLSLFFCLFRIIYFLILESQVSNYMQLKCVSTTCFLACVLL